MYMYVINLVVQLHVQCTSIHEPDGYQYIIMYCTQWPNLMYISTFEQNKILQNTILI